MHLRAFTDRLSRAECTTFRRALAQAAEVSRQTVWNWEHSRHRPTPEHMWAISRLTNGLVTTGDMLYG